MLVLCICTCVWSRYLCTSCGNNGALHPRYVWYGGMAQKGVGEGKEAGRVGVYLLVKVETARGGGRGVINIILYSQGIIFFLWIIQIV